MCNSPVLLEEMGALVSSVVHHFIMCLSTHAVFTVISYMLNINYDSYIIGYKNKLGVKCRGADLHLKCSTLFQNVSEYTVFTLVYKFRMLNINYDSCISDTKTSLGLNAGEHIHH